MISRDDLELEDDTILYDPADLDAALIGFSYDCGQGQVAIYSYEKLIDAFMTLNDWDREGAIEWIEFNVTGAYLGPKTPHVVNLFEDDI